MGGDRYSRCRRQAVCKSGLQTLGGWRSQTALTGRFFGRRRRAVCTRPPKTRGKRRLQTGQTGQTAFWREPRWLCGGIRGGRHLMTLPELHAVLDRLGVELTARGDKLHYKAKSGSLTPEIKAALAAHKR